MAITILGSPYFISASRNKMPYIIDVDPAWDTYDDYYLRIIVYKETSYRSGVQEQLFEISAYPNPDAQVLIDVSRALQGLLQPDSPIGYPSSGTRICQKMNARYNIVVQEWRNGVVVGTQATIWQHVIRAGFRSHYGQYLFDWTDNHYFLTRQPRVKKVTKIQPERLYYCLSQNLLTTNLDVKVEVTYENGLTADASPGWSITADEGDVIEITTGYQALNLSAAGLVAKWKIWLEEQTSGLPVSEEMVYELDCYCTPLDRYFLFENSLGGYDVIRTKGDARRNLLVSSVTAERPDNLASFTEYRQGFQVDTSYRNETEQSVGFLSREEKKWIADLLLSEDAYRLGEGPEFGATDLAEIPILIRKANAAFQDDADLLEKQSFVYTDSNPQRGL